MEAQDIAALQAEKGPGRLLESALRLAAAGSTAGLDAVARALADAAFLARLDDARRYGGPPHTLRVARILEELERNPSANGGVVLARLTQERVFHEHLARTELLIPAVARLRPPPAEVLRFWKEHAGPEDSSTPLVVKALFKNDSEQSMRLFAFLYSSEMYADADKVMWLRSYAVPGRDRFEFLTAALRLVRGAVKQKLKMELARVIFDHSLHWYPVHGFELPPNPLLIEDKARAVLLEFGDVALAALKPAPDLKLAIAARLRTYRGGN